MAAKVRARAQLRRNFVFCGRARQAADQSWAPILKSLSGEPFAGRRFVWGAELSEEGERSI